MRVASIPAAAVCLILSGRSDGKIVEIWNHRHDVSLPQPSERHQARPIGTARELQIHECPLRGGRRNSRSCPAVCISGRPAILARWRCADDRQPASRAVAPPSAPFCPAADAEDNPVDAAAETAFERLEAGRAQDVYRRIPPKSLLGCASSTSIFADSRPTGATSKTQNRPAFDRALAVGAGIDQPGCFFSQRSAMSASGIALGIGRDRRGRDRRRPAPPYLHAAVARPGGKAPRSRHRACFGIERLVARTDQGRDIDRDTAAIQIIGHITPFARAFAPLQLAPVGKGTHQRRSARAIAAITG